MYRQKRHILNSHFLTVLYLQASILSDWLLAYDTLSFPIADRLLCSAYRKSDANFVTWIQLILVALAQHAAPTQPPASSSALVAYRASIAAGLLAFLSLTMG